MIVHCLWGYALESDTLSTEELCGLGQVTETLWPSSLLPRRGEHPHPSVSSGDLLGEPAHAGKA